LGCSADDAKSQHKDDNGRRNLVGLTLAVGRLRGLRPFLRHAAMTAAASTNVLPASAGPGSAGL